jgi:nucleoside transporter
MSTPAPDRTALPVKARLSAAMFLQWFIQGSYLPIATVYLQDGLGFPPQQAGLFMAALAAGPLLAPFLVGQFVDRWFATERVLAGCHLAAGLLLLALYAQTEFLPVLLLGTAYSILYVPTVMLMNALTFAHLRDRDREFPLVRVWGTVGFIVPAFLIELWLLRGLHGEALAVGRGVAFLVAGLAEVALALYCLALPHTPPNRDPAARFAPAAVLRLLRRRDFQALVAAALLAAACHTFFTLWSTPYFKTLLRRAGVEEAAEQRLSSIGQFAELAVMAALGVLLARWGYRAVVSLGLTAYLVRCLLFAGAPLVEEPWGALAVAATGQALHGFCIACFWAAGYIYVDRVAGADLRGSMQTFFGTFVFGLGLVAGGVAGGAVGRAFSTGEGPTAVYDWPAIWLVPAGIAAVTLLGFVLLFRPAAESQRSA